MAGLPSLGGGMQLSLPHTAGVPAYLASLAQSVFCCWRADQAATKLLVLTANIFSCGVQAMCPTMVIWGCCFRVVGACWALLPGNTSYLVLKLEVCSCLKCAMWAERRSGTDIAAEWQPGQMLWLNRLLMDRADACSLRVATFQNICEPKEKHSGRKPCSAGRLACCSEQISVNYVNTQVIVF